MAPRAKVCLIGARRIEGYAIDTGGAEGAPADLLVYLRGDLVARGRTGTGPARHARRYGAPDAAAFRLDLPRPLRPGELDDLRVCLARSGAALPVRGKARALARPALALARALAPLRPRDRQRSLPLAPEGPLLLFWPDYSGTNPYQRLAYGDLPAGLTVRAGAIAEARALRQAARARGAATPVIFHQHWTAPVFDDATSPAEAAARARAHLDALHAFRAAGGIVLWTVHNLADHEGRFAEAEAALCAGLARCADLVHVHGAGAVETVRQAYGVPEPVLRVAPHGAYHGVYPDRTDRAAARAALGLPAEARVLVTLGLLRPYKGLDALLAAAGPLLRESPCLHVVIAGRPVRIDLDALRRRVAALPRVTLHVGAVPDERLQIFLRAADFAVLPYRAVLTSGAAYLALTFGTPVIAPAAGVLPEAVRDGETGYLYPPGDADGLAAALRRAVAATPEDVARLATGAAAQGRAATWAPLQSLIGGEALARAEAVARGATGEGITGGGARPT